MNKKAFIALVQLFANMVLEMGNNDINALLVDDTLQEENI